MKVVAFIIFLISFLWAHFILFSADQANFSASKGADNAFRRLGNENYVEIYKERVQQAQLLLKKLGYYEGETDGIPSPATRKAIEAFQKDTSLVVDGIIGPDTLRALTLVAAPPGECVIDLPTADF